MLGNANVATWGEDEVLSSDVVERLHGTIAFLVFERAIAIVGESLGNAVDVVLSEFAQFACHHRTHVAGIDKNDLAWLRLLTTQEPKADRDARAIEQLAGQCHDALHEVGLQNVLADVALASRLTAQRTIGKHHTDASRWREVTNHVLQPSEVGIALWRNTIAPAHILLQAVGSPVAHVERWIRHHEVCLQRRVLVIEESICILIAQVGLNTTDGKVHHRHLTGVGIDFLSEDTQVLDVALMVAHEVGTLHKHTTTTHGRVVAATFVRLQHGNDGANDAARRVELTSILALERSEFRQTVFVGASQEVLVLLLLAQFDGIGEEVHHVAQAALVQFGTGKVLGQDTLQAVVLLLNLHHGIVDDLTNLRRVSSLGNHIPTCIGWHIENVFRRVFVLVLLETVALIHQLLMLHVETIGDVLQEDKPQHHILILRSINRATEQVGCLPNLILKTEVCCIVFLCHIL